MTPFLAIHAKGGESISPKQKDRTTTYFKKKEFFNWVWFSIDKFQNWYLIVFKRGRNVVFQNWYIKTLLNTKRRISFRGSFVLVKGKAFETGGENFNSSECF
jgi:lantibiotic modifying enzyme